MKVLCEIKEKVLYEVGFWITFGWALNVKAKVKVLYEVGLVSESYLVHPWFNAPLIIPGMPLHRLQPDPGGGNLKS